MHDEQALTRRSTELGSYLLEAGLSVTTAESCTGGWIAKVITDIAGVRRIFSADLSPTVMMPNTV